MRTLRRGKKSAALRGPSLPRRPSEPSRATGKGDASSVEEGAFNQSSARRPTPCMRIRPRMATSCDLPSASSTRLLIYTVRTAVNGRLSDAPQLRSGAGRSPRPPVLREVQREVRPFARKGFRPTPASSRLPSLVRRGNCEALEAGKTCAAMPARWAGRAGDEPPQIDTRPGRERPLPPRMAGRRDFYLYGSSPRGPLATAPRRRSSRL